MVARLNFLPFIITVILLFGCGSDKETVSYKISPPFKNISVEAKKIELDPAKEQVVRFQNGISIEVPAFAFVNSKGEVVKDPVELKLETYDTPAQILASGIPMKFNTDGKEEDFESAGMFKLEGYSKGEKIEIASDKKLHLNHPSNTAGDFDFFYFEQNESKTLQSAAVAGGNEPAQISGSWKKLSNKPEFVFDSSKVIKDFKLKFASDQYPELRSLDDVNWHLASTYGDPTSNENKWVMDTKWSSIEISKPKYGFGTKIFSEPVNMDATTSGYSFISSGSLIISENNDYIVMAKGSSAKIWAKKTGKFTSIDQIKTDFGAISTFEDKYLLIERAEGVCLYNYQGVKLANLGETFEHTLIPGTNKIVCEERGWLTGEYGLLHIYDISGKHIKEIKLKNDPDFGADITGVMSDFKVIGSEIVTNSADGIKIFDSNGNLKTSKPEKYHYLTKVDETSLILSGLDGTLTYWNLKNNSMIKSNPADFDVRMKTIDKTWYSGHYYPIKGTSYVIVNEADYKKGGVIWDHKTNRSTRVDFELSYYPNEQAPELIFGSKRSENKGVFYNLNTKKEIFTLQNMRYHGEGYSLSDFSKNGKLFLVNAYTHVQLRKRDGSLVKDFKQYDSLIESCGFNDERTIYTLSSDGKYCTWDLSGKLLSSARLQDCKDRGYRFEKKIQTYNNFFMSHKEFALTGKLHFDQGRNTVYNIDDTTKVFLSTPKGNCQLISLFNLPEHVYQLTLRTDKEEFQTYIVLDKGTKETIDRYNTFLNSFIIKKTQQENNRIEQEAKLMRSFEIAKFGLYNWDKFPDPSSRIEFIANFKFDVLTDYNNITIFLVTSPNGTGVIRFPKNSWNKFAIIPTVPNKLVAVLPDNRIAVISDEELKKIDWEKVKKDKTYTFKISSIKTLKNLKELETLL